MSNSRSFNYECLDESKKNKCCSYTQPQSCGAPVDYCHYNCGCAQPKKSIFACKQGNTFTIPTTSPTTPILVSNLAVDTSCCCNPSIKLDFNGLINYQGVVTGTPTTITTPFSATFQLSRTCSDGTKMVLGAWDFSYASSAAATNVTIPFNFTYCECNACGSACGSSDCCVYTLEIIRTNATTFDAGTIVETVTLRTSNVAITAICN